MTDPLRRLAVVAIVMTIVAALHLVWLAPLGPVPFATTLLLLGAFACAVYGGLWPGLLATLIGLAVLLLSWRQASTSSHETLQVALFAATGILASFIAQAARQSRLRADADRAGLRRQMQERAAAELRLASSEQRFRTVVDALPDLVFTVDEQGRFRALNAHWLDCESAQETPEPRDFFALVHPDDGGRVRGAWGDAIATAAPLDLRCRLRARDHSYRWTLVRAQASAVPSANGERWFGVIIDIDKELSAERALRESDERLRLAVDATELGMWEYDFTTDTAVCSERVYAIAGLEKNQPINQAIWLALVVPADLQALVEHARSVVEAAAKAAGDAAQARGTFDVEYRLRRASDGAVRWVALTGRVVFDDSKPDQAVRATGTLRDVTRHREAIEKLRHSEERLELAQDAGGIGMFDWDLETNALACSKTEEVLLGFEPGTFAGTGAAMRAMVHPADHDAVENALELALERDAAYADLFRIVRPDGAVRWISAAATISRSSEAVPVRMVGVHRDVTDDKQAAQRLEAGEERFRLATEALDGLIYDFDPIEDHVERSSGLYDLTGFRVFDVPATRAWWRSRIHVEDLARIDESFDKAVGEGAVRIEQDYRVRHRDGQWIHVNERALLVWRNRVVCRIVGVVTDVTERRRIERVLHDADRRKDEFLAVLAHELRNPLAPIRNAVQMIGRASDPALITDAAAILERQVSQMVRLIDDLLDVSRFAQGKLKVQRKPVPLASIIDAAVETVQPLLAAKQQVFEASLAAAGVTVHADTVRLSQVIASLLNNASKYTGQGGRIALTLEVVPQEGAIELLVSDSGIGIAPESLETIFTMFSQLPTGDERDGDTGESRHDGLGIGLALARAVVSLHGGTLRATSEGIGRGAQFVLRLPLSDSIRSSRFVADASSDAPHWRVLVVDDNRDSAESLAAVLRLDRHEALVAYGGREALAVAERERPDLILLDIGMPDMDGYEVARRLRACEPTANTRIVTLSGYGQAGDREKSLAAGCDGHLVKPVSVADLARWLDRDAARDEVRT
ncbi:MAG TPA: PAS domain-containing protein [Burkholderiaceae bacterium]|nr:PAS domain-containing protein [Burkholderiaceae bacterium]